MLNKYDQSNVSITTAIGFNYNINNLYYKTNKISQWKIYSLGTIVNLNKDDYISFKNIDDINDDYDYEQGVFRVTMNGISSSSAK